MALKLTNVRTRLCPGNPLHHHVQLIRTKTKPVSFYTSPISYKEEVDNVLIAFSNDTIAKYTLQTLAETVPSQQTALIIDDIPMFIPMCIANTLRMQLVTVLNTYSDLETRMQVWHVHFYQPKALPTQMFRQLMSTPISD